MKSPRWLSQECVAWRPSVKLTVTRAGDRRALPRTVDQAAYRILQEALTNAARHGTGSAELALRLEPDRLELTIRNAVPPGPTAAEGGGHGLIGMRERAQLLGGALTTGMQSGTFTVHAVLPTGARTHVA